VSSVSRWRIGADVRSADIGAAAVFAEAVNYDDTPPLPLPGLVDVLSSWVWQQGRDTCWWLGAVIEARSAADAAQRTASIVTAQTGSLRTVAVTVHATLSTASSTEELVAEEEVDLHAMPGSAAPYIVPVRACAYARSGQRLTIEWISGSDPLAHVTLTVTESLTIGLFEHRSPLTGPEATGDPMIAKRRHVVVELGDVPASLPVLDRYSGENLPQGNDHPEAAPIKPFIYAPDGSDAPSM
jgi:hypothetical protein